MHEISLAFALRDAAGELLTKSRRLWPELQASFRGLAALVTTDTHPEWKSFLSNNQIPVRSATPNWDHIGLHRRLALELATANSNTPHYMYADIDHLLRWQERNPKDLQSVLLLMSQYDCLVVGRTEAGFSAAPRRLQQTEAVVNEIFRLVSGHNWDVMMGNRGLSRKAALRIVESCKVDTLGNDVAWPLMLIREGFNVGYVEADGLTYETNTIYANDLKDSEDEDPSAWILRVYAAGQHVDAMRPFVEDDAPDT